MSVTLLLVLLNFPTEEKKNESESVLFTHFVHTSKEFDFGYTLLSTKTFWIKIQLKYFEETKVLKIWIYMYSVFKNQEDKATLTLYQNDRFDK